MLLFPCALCHLQYYNDHKRWHLHVVVVQLRCRVWLFVTLWTAECSLHITEGKTLYLEVNGLSSSQSRWSERTPDVRFSNLYKTNEWTLRDSRSSHLTKQNHQKNPDVNSTRELTCHKQTQLKEFMKKLSPCLFNLYAEYIMRNAGLGEAQAGIKIAGIKKYQ